MNLQELYERTSSQLKELEQEMPLSYEDCLRALDLLRLVQHVMVTTIKFKGDMNEKMEILDIPSDTVRDNGSDP